MKYLRNLNNHNDYTTFIIGADFDEIQIEKKAVVSYCKSEKHVHYNPYIPTFFCKLTLEDGSIIEIEGSGELTYDMIYNYSSALSAEIGTLCTSIGKNAFYEFWQLTSVIIPDSVTSIGESAFYLCDVLTSVTIPNTVTSIGDYAFSNCKILTSIVIPDSVTSIGTGAFISCEVLTSVTIGNGVTSIGERAFMGCDVLTSVTINATTPPVLGEDAFNNNSSERIIYVPSASVEAYKSAAGWSVYTDSIQAIQ